jgi:hypothetical protein
MLNLNTCAISPFIATASSFSTKCHWQGSERKRTILALACDVEEMFHTHKVTGRMQVSVCDRPGDKAIVLPGSAAYTGRDLPISLLMHSVAIFPMDLF